MKQRILFVTPDYSFFTQPVTKSLKILGFNVKTFDYYKPSTFVRLTGFAGNHSLLPPSFAKKKVNTLINQALLKTINSFKPDYLLVIKGETITPKTIKTITAEGVITINWYSDWFGAWKWIVSNAPHYSVFINMCRETQRRLQKIAINSFYLPVASYLDNPPQRAQKIYPVTFVGQHTPRREKYFMAIKDLGLKIWGYKDWQDSRLKDIARGPVSVAESRQIIRQSKITVNLLNGRDGYEPDQVNTRTVETTSVDSFLLVKDSTAVQRYFQPGKEVSTFTTPQNLREKVIYYLNNEMERERIAHAGYLRTKKDHTLNKRLKKMFSLVKHHFS